MVVDGPDADQGLNGVNRGSDSLAQVPCPPGCLRSDIVRRVVPVGHSERRAPRIWVRSIENGLCRVRRQLSAEALALQPEGRPDVREALGQPHWTAPGSALHETSERQQVPATLLPVLVRRGSAASASGRQGQRCRPRRQFPAAHPQLAWRSPPKRSRRPILGPGRRTNNFMSACSCNSGVVQHSCNDLASSSS